MAKIQTLAELKLLLNQRETDIKKLEGQLREIDKQRNKILSLIDELKGVKSRPVKGKSNTAATLLDTMIVVLKETGDKPMSLHEVAKAVMKKGFKTKSTLPVFKAGLSFHFRERKELFKKHDRGFYTLASQPT